MNKLEIYLNHNTGFSFSTENVDFIEDIFNGHGYLLFIKDDILYRKNEEDLNEPAEPYSYEDIFDFIVEAIDEFEDLPAWQEEDLKRKLDNLPNPYM